jgi:hypothetical protein
MTRGEEANGLSWCDFFEIWCRSRFKHTRFLFRNYARGGVTSLAMMRQLAANLQREQVVLTGRDLVFLDHSVNDATRDATMSKIATGVEGLIRVIYRNSVGTLPTIILLEAWPRKDYGIDYTEAYDQIAQYYRIPVWSYRDAVWSEYAQNVQRGYNKYLTQQNPLGKVGHPVWFVHLYHADLYAAILVQESVNCTATTLTKALRGTGDNKIEVPPALTITKEHKLNLCDDTVISLLDASAETEYMYQHKYYQTELSAFNTTTPLSTIANAASIQRNGWILKEDRRSKFGWVAELPRSRTDNSSNARYEAAPLTQQILFQFNISQEYYLRHVAESRVSPRRHILELQYMRTYENAGTANADLLVSINSSSDRSGVSIGSGVGVTYQVLKSATLDARWADYKENHVSLTHYFAEDFVLPYTDSVDYSKPLRVRIQWQYNDTWCAVGPSRFRRMTGTLGPKSALQLRSLDDAGPDYKGRCPNQKFKLISARVCLAAKSE